MNSQFTQFIVALAAVGFLGVATLIAVAGYVLNDTPPELVFALTGAISGIAGQASAYLFRLNGTQSRQG